MSNAAVPDPAVQQLKELLDAGIRRLDGDAQRLSTSLHHLLGKADIAAPPDAVRAVALARIHVQALRVQLEALQTDHPAKPKLLAGFAHAADGLAAMKISLAATTSAAARRYGRIAGERLARADRALLAADRAMGCVYGCRTAPIPKPRRSP